MDYRLYLFGEGGHIERFVALDAETDEEAISLATPLATGRAELWNLGRVVKTFPAESPQKR